jgi:transcriptional regulator with XRE-family HTH domain
MLGAELRKVRLRAGLTQEEVAAQANISREYLSMLENDKKSPTLDMLFRICGALGTRPSRLVARVENLAR